MLITVLCPQLSLYVWIFQSGKLWPSLARGTFLLARSRAGGGERRPLLPPRQPLFALLHQATESEAALLDPDPSQNHNTTTWDRKRSGNLTSISISFAQTESTYSQRNKFTFQFSFYLFSVHCGREIKISLSVQMGGFSCAMLQSREHFRLCREQRPACLLTWLWRNVHLSTVFA